MARPGGPKETLGAVAATLAQAIERVRAYATTEEELRIGSEKALANAASQLRLEVHPRYERSYTAEFHGRADAVYGRLVLEYESPGSLARESAVDHAADQLQDYMRAEVQGDGVEGLRRTVGVGFDGSRIFFARFRPSADVPVFTRGPVFDVAPESLETLLLFLRGLRRRPLTAEGLAESFGPESQVAKELVGTFYRVLVEHEDHPKIRTLFTEWTRIFGIVYGQEPAKEQEDAKALGHTYGMKQDVELRRLLFAVHTYYAIVMKLLASELASLQTGALVPSVVSELPNISERAMWRSLRDLEDGGFFHRLGIHNFLEADFFAWYLVIKEAPVREALRSLARAFDDFEPATGTLEPETTRDLLKKLYQYLVPRRLRHDLGEYYTPDWLAELVLDEVGFAGDPNARVIDPACGSGTFLVLAMRRAREWAAENFLQDRDLARLVSQNIVGFDLNPLAVIAARTNYLLALGNLVRHLAPLEIPVYLCDSVLRPRPRSTLFNEYEIPSSVGPFFVPGSVVNSHLLSRLLDLLNECIERGATKDRFLARASDELGIDSSSTLEELYVKISELERQDRNGVWAHILLNGFATVFSGRFDFVVGNPPWVNWEHLAGDYRTATAGLWQEYGLLTGQGQLARMRQGKKDLAMLMLYVACGEYLRDHGRLGFVVTQTLFKSSGAADGFRRFRLGSNGDHLEVLRVHDMTDLQPFEGATNRTAVLVLQRGSPTRYPLDYQLWRRNERKRISTDMTLSQVRSLCQSHDLAAQPVDRKQPTSPWLTAPQDVLDYLSRVLGRSPYQAREGINTGGLNGVYWLRILERRPDGLLVVENLHDVGTTVLPLVRGLLEPDLVYPLVRGKDVLEWYATPSAYVVLPQDREKQREGMPETRVETEYPHTYAYLKGFQEQLTKRPDRKYYPKDSPFYTMRNVASYTFASHKVLWPEVGNTVRAGLVSTINDDFLGSKPAIPDHTVVLVPTDSDAESAFVSAVLNSLTARVAIAAYIALHPSPHVMDRIAVPKFDHRKPDHAAIADIALRLSNDLASSEHQQPTSLRSDLEHRVAALWGIPRSALSRLQSVATLFRVSS